MPDEPTPQNDPQPDPAPEPKADPAPAPEPEPEPEQPWHADLPDDLKKPAERFASKEDAVRAIVAFQKREGQVRVPGKDATDEERTAFHKAIGVPETPEGYAFPELPAEELTDEIKTSRAQWAKTFHENNVPKATADALIAAFDAEVKAAETAQVEADKAFATQQEEALKAEWKGDFDKNKTLANRAFADIASRTGLKLDDLTKIEMKDGRFLMDRAEMLRIFATIGREMAEGTLGPVLTEGEREGLDEQVRDVRKKIAEAQAEGDSKRANALYQKEMALLAKMHGRQPIVGAEGRVA